MEVETMDPAQQFEANLLPRMKPLNELTARGTSAVQQFYSGATVFVTGGSGFLGKQLIEKLFRATNVSKIFILLRSKKGKSIQQRLTEILQDPLYDVLREQQPDFAKKLVPVSGDVAELRLDLSEEDWNTITEQVEIVFHVAATTRFDETLRVATLINIRGTREALQLGKSCKNLRSFVYVSTAYSCARLDRTDTNISEKFYKSPIGPNAMIELVETVEESRINDITPRYITEVHYREAGRLAALSCHEVVNVFLPTIYFFLWVVDFLINCEAIRLFVINNGVSLINNWPNTYSFSKSIAEELVNTIGNDLPISVVRPAIVVCTKLEPTPGWLDMSCVYGASGLLIAIGLGIMHTIKANTEVRLELVPVDYVNNAIIAAGWETDRRRAAGENKTKIYVVSASRNPILWREFSNTMKSDKDLTPMLVGPIFSWCTKNPILFWIYSWLLHLIPAYIIDGISVIFGKQRRFVKLAKKMYKMTSALSPYACHQWKFDDQNTAELYDSLSKEDRVIFNFNMDDIDWREYLFTWGIGARKYIIKDGLTGTLYARKKEIVFRILAYILLPLYFYTLCKILYFALSLFTAS